DLCIPPAAVQSPASGTAAQPTFFDGIGTSILSLQQYRTFPTDIVPKLAGDIDSAASNFNPTHPEAIAPTLADGLKIVDQLIHFTETSSASTLEKYNALHELRIKQTQLNQALTLALGLSLKATAASADLPAQTPSSVTTTLSQTSAEPITYVRAWSSSSTLRGVGDGASSHGGPVWKVSRDKPLTRECGLSAEESAVTRPYFTRTNIEVPVYTLLTSDLRNAPAAPAALSCWAMVNFMGVDITIGATALHDGQPVRFVPPINLSTSSPTQLLLPGQKSVTIAVHGADPSITANTLTPDFEVSLKTPPNWIVKPDILPSGHVYRLTPPSLATQPATVQAIATSTSTHHEYTEGYRSIGYGGLPRTNIYTPASTRIVPLNLTVPESLGIAYLPGTGDDIPSALTALGYNPTILKVSDLTPDTLDKFDTVILGVRTYNAHPDLHGIPTQALLDYARNGGNVLVQFQTDEFTADDAPFPLSLGRSAEKVVDETDPVKLLESASPLLTTPNRITPTDFDNWFEERGHGFLSTWDTHYTALLEVHDPGSPEEGVQPELPQRGGLITTHLGKGRWTYCAFALYRQLPEANPGAFRLFINLITPPARR
ncbi:MAG: hypothetical protein V4555_21890, partial [Acidobacteriota bacterium]